MSAPEQQDVGAPKGFEAPPPTTDTVNTARRRLLIGALAGPAAVSLPVTASAAAFGSISTCVENVHGTYGMRLHVSGSSVDKYARKWVRGIVVEKKIGRWQTVRETLVRYDDGRYYDEDYNEWYPKGGDKFISPTGETYKDDGDRENRYTLLFADVDEHGDFVATSPSSTTWGAVPVTTSCYVSIGPIRV